MTETSQVRPVSSLGCHSRREKCIVNVVSLVAGFLLVILQYIVKWELVSGLVRLKSGEEHDCEEGGKIKNTSRLDSEKGEGNKYFDRAEGQ